MQAAPHWVDLASSLWPSGGGHSWFGGTETLTLQTRVRLHMYLEENMLDLKGLGYPPPRLTLGAEESSGEYWVW